MRVRVLWLIDNQWVEDSRSPAVAGLAGEGRISRLWVAMRSSGYGSVLWLAVRGEVG